MTPEKETPTQADENKGTFETLQEGVTKTAREIWLAGLGVFATIDQEGSKLFNKFVERGREVAEGQKAAKMNSEPEPTDVTEKKDQFTQEVFSKLESAAVYIRRKISELSERAPDASREELKTLTEKVDKLSEAVAALMKKMDEDAKTGAKKASF